MKRLRVRSENRDGEALVSTNSSKRLFPSAMPAKRSAGHVKPPFATRVARFVPVLDSSYLRAIPENLQDILERPVDPRSRRPGSSNETPRLSWLDASRPGSG